jgi:hypothetical protein
MTTLDDIRKASSVPVITSVDDTTPEGYFAATCKILGIVTDYLCRGAEDDGNAPIVGRIEIDPDSTHSRPYRGRSLKGGHAMFGVHDAASAFAAMVAVDKGD